MTSGVFDDFSDEDFEKDFNAMIESPHRIDKMIEIDGKTIGHISLSEQPGKWWETQIVIGEKEFQDKGYGTEAIKKLINEVDQDIVKQIYLEVRPNNERAIRVYEKCGFTKRHLIKHSNNPNLPQTLRMEYVNK